MRNLNLSTTETLITIKEDLGIKSVLHDDGRVILNYDMIESPKLNELARECRGLVLDSNNDWALVARAFTRFFNLGEYREEQDDFIWEWSTATDKEDGSLILIYYHEGEWFVNTRGSFAEGMVGDSIFTWRDLVDFALGDYWKDRLDPALTYVGELCSMYNKIVRIYKKPKFYLLSCFCKYRELSEADCSWKAQDAGMELPEIHYFSNDKDVVRFIEIEGDKDPTFEGVVLRDINNMRIKVKSKLYLELHRLNNNGNLASAKNLISFILKGEEDEVLVYFPELEELVNEIKWSIEKEYLGILNYWFHYKDIKNQREFAEAILPCRFSSILFSARKLSLHPQQVWLESEELIYKVLYK